MNAPPTFVSTLEPCPTGGKTTALVPQVYLWASPSFPDTFNNMMCSGEFNDEDKKELHGRVQA